MPDIIVTTPKNRVAEAAREAEEVKAAGGGYYYRYFSPKRAPKIEKDDRVYYIEDGYIRGFCEVVNVDHFNDVVIVWMSARSWTWIKPIRALPFQVPRSFMYAEKFDLHLVWWWLPRRLTREAVEVVGGWLEPKPEVPLEKDKN